MDLDTFRRLMQECHRKTRFYSTQHWILVNTSFLEIKKEGKDILPFVIDCLREKDCQFVHICFALLWEITQVNPIKEENSGYVSKMRDDWLEWAIVNGY